MLTHQIVITLTPALSLEWRGRKTNPHSLLSILSAISSADRTELPSPLLRRAHNPGLALPSVAPDGEASGKGHDRRPGQGGVPRQAVEKQIADHH